MGQKDLEKLSDSSEKREKTSYNNPEEGEKARKKIKSFVLKTGEGNFIKPPGTLGKCPGLQQKSPVTSTSCGSKSNEPAIEVFVGALQLRKFSGISKGTVQKGDETTPSGL